MSVHAPRDLECWGCNRDFKSPAGMFIHLEAGTCNCGHSNSSIIRNVVKCRGPWKNDDTGYPFRCPTCNTVFARVSGLLQHIESNSCDEGYNGGRLAVWGLLRQLRRNLGFRMVELYGRDV